MAAIAARPANPNPDDRRTTSGTRRREGRCAGGGTGATQLRHDDLFGGVPEFGFAPAARGVSARLVHDAERARTTFSASAEWHQSRMFTVE